MPPRSHHGPHGLHTLIPSSPFTGRGVWMGAWATFPSQHSAVLQGLLGTGPSLTLTLQPHCTCWVMWPPAYSAWGSGDTTHPACGQPPPHPTPGPTHSQDPPALSRDRPPTRGGSPACAPGLLLQPPTWNCPGQWRTSTCSSLYVPTHPQPQAPLACSQPSSRGRP